MDKIDKTQAVETNFTDGEATAMAPTQASEGKLKRFAKRTWKYVLVGALSAVGGYALGRRSGHGESTDANCETGYESGYETTEQIPEE